MWFETEAFQLISTLINNLLAYVARPDVLRQLVLGFGALFLAESGWRLLKRTATARLPEPSSAMSPWRQLAAQWFVRLWQRATRPALALLLLTAVIAWETRRGALVGLLSEFSTVTAVFLFAAITVATLYTVSGHDLIKRFATQFLWPVLLLFVAWRLLRRLINVQTLLDSELVTIFGSAITVSAALIATIGLYLWVVGANLLDDAAVAVLSRRRDDVGSAKATLTLIRYLLIVVGIGIAISQLNFDATTVAAITGGLSVGVGFALSTILSNFISGLILLFERSIHPGDVLEIDDELSIVEDVSMRSIRVRTFNNVEVVIPNETFISSSFTTFTGTDKRIRIQLPVSSGYDDDPTQVQKVVRAVAIKNQDVLMAPMPEVQLVAFGDNSVDYLLNCWLPSPMIKPKAISDLNYAIFAAFEEHGFSIPYPQRDVHIIQPPADTT